MLLIDNLSKNFGHRSILSGISYHFPSQAHVALIGANGVGKTTLLNILCDLDEADSGRIVKPKNLKLGYLPQEPSSDPLPSLLEECLSGARELQEILLKRNQALIDMGQNFSEKSYEVYEKLEHQFEEKGGYKLESEAKGLLVSLGFSNDQIDQDPKLLSGGWRMRLELAKVLINHPNFLILDEPTNHLDLPTILWFENYIRSFQGTVVFVSHDEEFLNKISTHTLHLFKGKLKEYVGNFSKFLDAFDLQQQQGLSQKKNLEQQIDHIQKFVDRFRAKPSKARQVQSRINTLSKLTGVQETIVVDQKEEGMVVKISQKRPSGKHVFEIDNLDVGYDKPLIKKLNLHIHRGMKLAIIGANGYGKTTLLKTIMNEIPKLGGEVKEGHNVDIGYYSQASVEQLDFTKTVLENVMMANPAVLERQARSLLGSLQLAGDDVFKPISILSGGEKSRVVLACLLIREPNTIILDEPTNHLDIQSALNLSLALSAFEGTVICVSHNQAFLKTVGTHVLGILKGGRTRMIEGSIEDFYTMMQKEKLSFT